MYFWSAREDLNLRQPTPHVGISSKEQVRLASTEITSEWPVMALNTTPTIPAQAVSQKLDAKIKAKRNNLFICGSLLSKFDNTILMVRSSVRDRKIRAGINDVAVRLWVMILAKRTDCTISILSTYINKTTSKTYSISEQ